jgi:type IV pilus assembly protein PilZ
MSDELERRQDERAAIELKVEYQRLNTFFYDYTKNISKGGTFIKTNRPLDIGTQFLFKLYVPSRGEPLQLHGQVRWVQREGEPPRDGGDGEPGMGIQFLYDDDQQRLDVERTVKEMMVASLGPVIYAQLRRLGEGT